MFFTIKFVSKIINNCNSNIKFESIAIMTLAGKYYADESGIVYPTVTVNGIGERAEMLHSKKRL